MRQWLPQRTLKDISKSVDFLVVVSRRSLVVLVVPPVDCFRMIYELSLTLKAVFSHSPTESVNFLNGH